MAKLQGKNIDNIKTSGSDFERKQVPEFKYLDDGMYDVVKHVSSDYPDRTALKFDKKTVTFEEMIKGINLCARALLTRGVKKGDYVTIACPNCIEAVYCIYAVNKIGAICNMIHPLSSSDEIKYYVNEVNSTTIIIFNLFFNNFKKIWQETNIERAIVVDISYELSFVKKTVVKVKTLQTSKELNNSENVFQLYKIVQDEINTEAFIEDKEWKFPKVKSEDAAAILYSGGTTGKPKGIVLTNSNFNSLARQIFITEHFNQNESRKALSIMPLFHGFGLGLFVHGLLANAVTCVLVMRFNSNVFEKTLYKEKCNYVAGVPTLYEDWTKSNNIKNHDYSFLCGLYCGGDKLTNEQKIRFNKFLRDHNCQVTIREGYGLTETVTCCCLMPKNDDKPNSIGIPLPDMYMKVIDRDTFEEKAVGEEGELVIRGPLVMKGYYNDTEETHKVLHKHKDGKLWLHSGDAGTMDSDGFFYFKGRYKRVIVTSGYTVYPNVLEEIINTHEYVRKCCVIGIPDERRGQKIIVLVELNNGFKRNDETKDSIMTFCKDKIGKHQVPREVKLLKQLPTTKVGKIDYLALEKTYSE